MEDILVAHSGKQHAYQLALALQHLGRLNSFITSAYYKPGRFPDRLLKKIDHILKKRNQPGLEEDRVKRFPFFEAPELALRAVLGNSPLVSNSVCLRDGLFDKFVARTQVKGYGIFWGFQGSCLESLQVAQDKGITAVMELATAHISAAQKILGEERWRNPEWQDSISNLYFPKWYLKRLEKEPRAADFCVVASAFSKTTLMEAGIPSAKILTLPLGVDLNVFRRQKKRTASPLQVLFVGGVGQRKGVKYLLEAVKKLNTDKIKLKIIGPIIGSGRAFKKYAQFYEYLGAMGRGGIAKEMQESDLLVLPSLFEGFGLVILEAMACGLPVIASPYSAAPELIREGRDGFVLEPRDVEKLAEKLQWLLINKDKAREMGESAAERAGEFSWLKYEERLGRVLQTISYDE
ncbi:MAG: glycosyltransferase family 4 protein [Candidatus Omnitrophota bacterium]|jgi:glycosyltransferase involved in cell wall biosynthesis